MKLLAVVAVIALGCASSDAAPIAKGRVVDAKLKSASLGVVKHLKIYLPASYDTSPAKRYPVFYYLHGLGGDETNWTNAKLHDAADKLALDAIVVMPDSDDSFYSDAVASKVDYEACKKSGAGLLDPSRSKAKTCVKDRKYETYIVKDLVDWTDKTYRTIATREGRGIAGFSMGGYGAFILALRNPERFAAAASHSGVLTLLYESPIPYRKGKVKLVDDVQKSWGGKLGPVGPWMRSIFGSDVAQWRANDPIVLISEGKLEKLGPNAPKLYFDCGTEDEFQFHNYATWLHDILLDRKIDHQYWVGPGHHDGRHLVARLPNSLQFLRKYTTAAK